jgi:hypothetical protein
MKRDLHSITDSDELDFSAIYGTAVRLLDAEESSPEVSRLLSVPRIGHLPPDWAYPVRHPRAA